MTENKTSRINRGNNVKALINEFAPYVGYDTAKEICESLSTQAREYIYFMYISKKHRADLK